MAGSEGFARSADLGIPDEPAAAGDLVHLAIVYRGDNSIALYRNGEPLGKSYTPAAPLQTFSAGDARILLGQRHTGGGRAWLTGESGWSVKALHRLIVNSDTYRQASTFHEKAATLDAGNTLPWRYAPRRLEAEAIRDAMLSVSGQLNLQPGGPGFRPFDAIPFPANAYAIADKQGPEFNRRTVYRMNVNSGKDPLPDSFDCPDPSVKTPSRGVTTTPLQALELMNNSFVQRQANHLAGRAMQAAGNDLPAAIKAAYRFALGRVPSPAEASRAAAAAAARGLTSVCWAMLNSTGFVYVR